MQKYILLVVNIDDIGKLMVANQCRRIHYN